MSLREFFDLAPFPLFVLGFLNKVKARIARREFFYLAGAVDEPNGDAAKFEIGDRFLRIDDERQLPLRPQVLSPRSIGKLSQPPNPPSALRSAKRLPTG